MNDFLQSLRNGQAEKQRTPKTRKNTENSYNYNTGPRFNSYGGYQNTRGPQMNRPPGHQQPGNQLPADDSMATTLLADAIENLSGYIETLAKNQEYMISVQERSADMLERQAIAIERIVDHLNIAPAAETEPELDDSPERTFENHYVTSSKQALDIPEPVEEIIEPVIPPETPVIRKRKKIVTKKRKEMVIKEPASTNSQLLSRDAVMSIIHSMRAEGATFDQVAERLIKLGQPTFSGRGEWHAQTIHRLCNKK